MTDMNDGARRKLGTFKFDDPDGEKRLVELMLHIADRCEEDATFGATKLSKILWWSDFLSYARHGAPITGVEYQRLTNGPAPKRLKPIRDQLVADREAVVRERKVFNRTQKRLIPLRPVNYELFTAEQIALVDEMISDMWEETAQSVSRSSHGKAWEIARDKQSIPYESVFLSDSPITRVDVVRTYEIADRHGWERA